MLSCSSGCAVTCVGIAALWILASSALLMFTWNKVITDIFKFKAVKFWQALLVVFTLGVMCLPSKVGKHRGCSNHGCPLEKNEVTPQK